MSFMSGLRSTQWQSCCMHSSHMATLASEARKRICSSATCCRNTATSRASDKDDSTVGAVSLSRNRLTEVGVASPATEEPATEWRGEDAGSIELVDERTDSAGEGGTPAAGEGGTPLARGEDIAQCDGLPCDSRCAARRLGAGSA